MVSFRRIPGSAGGLIDSDISGMPGLWPGGKDVARRKHRPGNGFDQNLRPVSAK